MDYLKKFYASPKKTAQVGLVTYAYRSFGKGPNLVLIHGWPFHGATYRFLIPTLAEHFTCIVPDLPGLGESLWEDASQLFFREQALNLGRLLDLLNIKSYNLIAHDTGATIARLVAADHKTRLGKMIILNTEMPGHRPPYIRLYQWMMKIPSASFFLKNLLKSNFYLRSPMGFGSGFHEASKINQEFKDLYLAPLQNNPLRMKGVIGYLLGIDWQVVDELPQIHAEITADVLLVWGAGDKTFPVDIAKKMVSQFKSCKGLTEINNAKLLVHEERPEELCESALDFFGA